MGTATQEEQTSPEPFQVCGSLPAPRPGPVSEQRGTSLWFKQEHVWKQHGSARHTEKGSLWALVSRHLRSRGSSEVWSVSSNLTEPHNQGPLSARQLGRQEEAEGVRPDALLCGVHGWTRRGPRGPKSETAMPEGDVHGSERGPQSWLRKQNRKRHSLCHAEKWKHCISDTVTL